MKYIVIALILSACNIVNVENTNTVPKDSTVVQDSLLIDTVTVIDTVYEETVKLTKADSMEITRSVMCQAYGLYCE